MNHALAEAGFDVQHAFDANVAAREPGLACLAGAERLGILVGNTRELWPPFVAKLGCFDGDNPLEQYTEREIEAAFPAARTYFAHRRYDGAFLPFQRLAVATGLGALAPTGLVIHPTFGPWFALRAIVLVDGEPVARVPIEKPCRCDGTCERALDSALQGGARFRIAGAGDASSPGPGDWRAWLAVRDACSLRTWRYTDEQVRYHYTKTWR